MSDGYWHALKLDGQEMNQTDDKFKEYNTASGAFLDDYIGQWSLKMDILAQDDHLQIWAKCPIKRGQMWILNCSKKSKIFDFIS